MHERTPSNSPSSRGDARIRPSANEDPSVQIPKTGTPSTPTTRVKSFVRKILLASPVFPRLYADVVIASAPNSNEAKILAHNYKKILTLTNNERTNPQMASKSCTHIKVTGVRCDSPALRGEQFCYFHQRMLRTVRVPSRVHHAALLEDAESIQASLMEVVNGLLRGTLELKRGELILRALNTAVRNIRRVHFDLHQEDMVREIPNYPTPPLIEVDEQAAAEAQRQAARAEIERVKAEHLAEYYAGLDKASAQAATPAPTHVATDTFVRPPNVANVRADHVGKDHVGTAALGCPGGPEVPGRSAVPPKPTTSAPPELIHRKPPVSVKPGALRAKAEAPKERKNIAHGASRG